MIQLYPFQEDIVSSVFDTWRKQLARAIAVVLPTGGGKTVIFSDIVKKHGGKCVVIAHRQELVQQASCALAKNGILHDIIAPRNVIQWVSSRHYKLFKTDFYRPGVKVVIAGVDTLLRRKERLKDIFDTTDLVVIDECHHVAKPNKWFKVLTSFKKAKILGVTATLLRTDKKGLGSHADGVFDTFIEGPNMRSLISDGFLSDYIIYGPTLSNFSRSSIRHGADGDFSKPHMDMVMKKTPIIGDVVTHYLKYARGKTGITFAPSVAMAEVMAENFRINGVPAKCVHSGTKDLDRTEAIDRLGNREILQIVNCDIFGEGFDLPAIEVVSFARPTESFILFCQQFGRALRIKEGKDYAIIIDHVGNIRYKHGLPDFGREWTLNRIKGRKKDVDPNLVKTKTCPLCTRVYRVIKPFCPYCTPSPIATSRASTPEEVDGDLSLYSPELIESIRKEINRVNAPIDEFRSKLEAMGMRGGKLYGAIKHHSNRLKAHIELSGIINVWSQIRRDNNVPDSESYREFFHKFGVDVLLSGTLSGPKAVDLTKRIKEDILL